MSKKWLIIPAAILAAGVGATGVLANARVAESPVNTVNLSETLNGNSRVDKGQGDFVNASENPNGGFVDNDNDGICNNQANGTGNGCGRGNGHHGNGYE